jgi:ATP-dependent protease HslVU (ClpYQ) peptidase subunit
MTTVAAREGKIACDSRLTGGFIAKANKIIVGDGVIVGYAGDWIAAECLGRHIAGLDEEKPKRDSDDDVEFLVLRPKGIFMVDRRLREVKICDKYWAIGSGCQAAMVAMHMGATAKEAVEMAKLVDECTGGRVREYSL